ncbi:hypothetical protein ES705_06619 [subsurface metagenome]
MKKNVLIKSILLLVVVALLAIGFTGCGAIIPTTGTVYVYTDSWDDYDIYMDGIYRGYSFYTSSYFVIYNVPVGYHTFFADGWTWDGSKYQYIYSGTNYVTITTW